MSTVLAYGDRALLVEVGDTPTVLRWVDALDAAGLDGVAGLDGIDDVIPAAETVLVVATSPAAVPALRRALTSIRPNAPAMAAPRSDVEVVEIAVRYDGPDLDDVAALTGLSTHEVVAAHTGALWRVAFGGFAPGFGYLVTEDHDRLHVPRRDSARTTVPAGAVALAGEYAGVYPRSSPGGWQLIGSTDVALWDLDRTPPALLSPGARVRFTDEGRSS